MSVVMAMIVPMAMVSMSKGSETDNVDQKSQYTDNQQFIETMKFATLPKALKSIEYDFDTDKPVQD